MRTRRTHGPYVDDDGERYVVDEAVCTGLDLVELNLEPVVVSVTREG